jgi:DNA-binding NarL/FixJ family response regulator
MSVRVVIADDHRLVRASIAVLLSLMHEVDVAAEAQDGADLMRVLATVAADLVLCDIAMPRVDGVESLALLRARHPGVKALVLSMDDSPAVIQRALKEGACGYVLKDAAPQELESAIRIVMSGGRYLSPGATRSLLTAGSPPEQQLTPRQIEILSLVAKGLSSREIGGWLGLSPKTVDVHRARIMERLELRDIASLTRYALRHRLIR